MPILNNPKLSFSASEKAVIEYLLQNKNQIAQLTLSQLAKLSNTSNATIIRLSKKLGFNGFSALKIALIKEHEDQKFTVSSVDFSFPFQPADSLIDIHHAMSSLYQTSIQKLDAYLDLQSLLKLAHEIIYSNRIFIFGTGDTGLTVRSFINKINKLDIYPIFGSANEEEDSNLKNIHEGDLAIIVSYESSNKDLIDKGIQTIVKNKGKIAVITSNVKNINEKLLNYLIKIPSEEGKTKLATFYSQFAFEYVLNLIFSITYRELILDN